MSGSLLVFALIVAGFAAALYIGIIAAVLLSAFRRRPAVVALGNRPK